MVILETQRLKLETFTEKDFPLLLDLQTDPLVMKFFGHNGRVSTAEEVPARLERLIQDQYRLGFSKWKVVSRFSGEFLGRAGFGPYQPTGKVAIGYALRSAVWGQGYATEAALALREWFFAEGLGNQFIGFVRIDNISSVRVLEKVGMNRRGVFDHDGVPHVFFEARAP